MSMSYKLEDHVHTLLNTRKQLKVFILFVMILVLFYYAFSTKLSLPVVVANAQLKL